MRLRRLFLVTICAALVAGVCSGIHASGQTGITETVFNRRFIPTLKPAMTYEQVAKMAGVPGARIAEDKKAAGPLVQYRWKGGRDSVLTVKFNGNKMVEAIVLAPNGHTYQIQSNGQTADITK